MRINIYKKVNDTILSRKLEDKKNREIRKREVIKKVPEFRDLIRREGEILFELVSNIKNKEIRLKLEEELGAIKDKKKSLLEENGFSSDYLEMRYYCPICKDEGTIGTKNCSCKNELINKEIYKLSGLYNKIIYQNFDTFDLNIFRKNRKENEFISPYENMQGVVKIAKAFCQDFKNGRAKNIFFYGQVGTGKTFILNSISKEIMDSGKIVYYDTANSLFNLYTDYQFSSFEDKEKYRDKIELVEKSDLLVIDDLGAEPLNSLKASIFLDILSKRSLSAKNVLISSNLSPYELENFYDERVQSRILGEYNCLEIFGDDLRMRSLGGMF